MSSYFGTQREVEAAQQKRNKEIRAWAAADQAHADQVHGLIGVPTSFDTDWDVLEEPTTVPAVLPVSEEPEPEPENEGTIPPVEELKTAPKTVKGKATAPK